MASKPFIEVYNLINTLIKDEDCPDLNTPERACCALGIDPVIYKQKVNLVAHLLEKWIDFEEINIYIKC